MSTEEKIVAIKADNRDNPLLSPLAGVLDGIEVALKAWADGTGCRWDMQIKASFIETEPVGGFRNHRRGPQTQIILTFTDTSRLDDIPDAFYWDTADPFTKGEPVTLPDNVFKSSDPTVHQVE